MRTQPKYPNIEVQLSGVNGNAFMIIGTVQKVMRRNGVPLAEISAFVNEAMSGDYDHVLRTCMEWVEVC